MIYKTYETPETLRAIQVLSTFILEELDRVCKILGIQYFAYAGTALGAVRHQGFIPWDDDVDVIFLRDDYELFMKEAPQHLREPFVIQNVYTTKNWSSISSYLAIKGTVSVPAGIDPCTSHKLLGIDLFVLDVMSSKPKLRQKQLRNCFFWGRMIFIRATPKPFVPYAGIKKVLIHSICTLVHYAQRMLHMDAPKIYDRWKQSATAARDEVPSGALSSTLYQSINADTEHSVTCIDNTPRPSHESCSLRDTLHCTVTEFSEQDPLIWRMTPSEIFPLKQGKFEWIHIPLPNKVHEILARNYGNYMKLPPLEKQKNHHPAKLDFGPYDPHKLANPDIAVARHAFEEGIRKLDS